MSSSTNLNIRIDKQLKKRLDAFAQENDIPTSTLVISRIEVMLATGDIAPLVRLASKREIRKNSAGH